MVGRQKARLDQPERQRQAGGVLGSSPGYWHRRQAVWRGLAARSATVFPDGYPQAKFLHHQQQVGDRDRIAGLDGPQRHAGLRRASGAGAGSGRRSWADRR